MNVKKIVYTAVGCLGLGLGAVGAVVPLLPAFPFLLLACLLYTSISQSVSVIREAEPEAQIKEGLQVSSAGADDSSDEVSRWIEEIK